MTLEEFTSLVEKDFKNMCSRCPERLAETMEYFHGKEAQAMIRSEYDYYNEKFKSGALSEEQFRNYAAETVSYNLWMLA